MHVRQTRDGGGFVATAAPSPVAEGGMLARCVPPEWGPAERPPCLLVAEPTPVLLLGLGGLKGLDLLLVPGAEVRIAEPAAAGLPAGWLSDRAGRVELQRCRASATGHRLALDAVVDAAGEGRGVLAIADDASSRLAIVRRDLPRVRLLSTRCFLTWICRAFGVSDAARVRSEIAGVSAAGRA